MLAQKQNFDVVSYTAPKGWQQQQNEGGVQLSISDKKTGGYAIALITKATTSNATASENFNTDWRKLVKAAVQVNDEPTMLPPTNENGWDIISGTANYTDGEQKGLATMPTATAGGRMTSVVLMTNTNQYENELLAFLNSLDLAKATGSTTKNTTVPATSASGAPIVGMWVNYRTETNGSYNQLTGGYMRREYVFYGNGTYLFRAKDWMVYVKDIFRAYETGTYAVKGNQITITPKTGKGEWWSKAPGGRTSGWGKLVKAADYKPETISYTFQIDNIPSENKNKLLLTSNKPTLREGSSGTTATEHRFYYDSRNLSESLIDNPPGI